MWQWCTLNTELSLGWKLGQNGSNSQQSHHDSLTSALTKDARTLVVLASTCFPSNMWLARLWNRAGKLRCCSVPSPSCPVGWWVSFLRSLLLRVWVLQTTGTADNTDMKDPWYVLGRMGLRTLQRLQWCEQWNTSHRWNSCCRSCCRILRRVTCRGCRATTNTRKTSSSSSAAAAATNHTTTSSSCPASVSSTNKKPSSKATSSIPAQDKLSPEIQNSS